MRNKVIGGSRPALSHPFDLSAMGPDESITAATLRRHADAALYPTGNPSGQSMEVYRLTQPWEELAVSWNSRLSGALWTTPGGDYVGTTGVPGIHPYAANGTVVPDGYARPVGLSWNITSLVQEWHSGTYANHGLLLLSYPGNGLTFGSREAGADGYAIPQLEIQTAVMPEPAEAAALSALGLAGFGLGRRLRRSRDNPRHDVCRSSRCPSAQNQHRSRPRVASSPAWACSASRAGGGTAAADGECDICGPMRLRPR